MIEKLSILKDLDFINDVIYDPILPMWTMGIVCVFVLLMKRKGLWGFIRQLIIVLLLLAINMRVMIKTEDAPTKVMDVDVLFLVDNTISMQAEDYDEKRPRMEGVNETCEYIMKELEGASFAVSKFDDDSRRLTPYTKDTATIKQALSSLRGMSKYYAKGTSFEMAQEAIGKSIDEDRETYKVIFFITDGEIPDESVKMCSFKKYKDDFNAGAVLGFGTSKGGKMQVGTFFDGEKLEYLHYYDKNYNDKPAVSVIDEKNLKKIANDMSLEYVQISKPKDVGNCLEEIWDKINEEATESIEELAGYEETYYYFVIVLIGFMIFDFLYYRRKA